MPSSRAPLAAGLVPLLLLASGCATFAARGPPHPESLPSPAQP
ncbi:hypothetical protein [Archangium violaceum]|nr:hypothetical protein [Archangium violaceum]